MLLLRHNLINALWLHHVIDLFETKGWAFTTPDRAFADPVYGTPPAQIVAGRDLLLSLARGLVMARFRGWERLVDDGEFEIAALSAQGIE